MVSDHNKTLEKDSINLLCSEIDIDRLQISQQDLRILEILALRLVVKEQRECENVKMIFLMFVIIITR